MGSIISDPNFWQKTFIDHFVRCSNWQHSRLSEPKKNHAAIILHRKNLLSLDICALPEHERLKSYFEFKRQLYLQLPPLSFKNLN
jgi:hypothetical protein